MTNADLHKFLRLELPCRESDIVDRLALLHRALPASYKDWPRTPEQVSEALQALAAKGWAEKRGFEWHYKAETKERMLFA